jgi:hypothetical protein
MPLITYAFDCPRETEMPLWLLLLLCVLADLGVWAALAAWCLWLRRAQGDDDYGADE